MDKLSLGGAGTKMGASFSEDPPVIVTGRVPGLRSTHVPQSDAVFWATRAGGGSGYEGFVETQSYTITARTAPGDPDAPTDEIIVNGRLADSGVRPVSIGTNVTELTYTVNGQSVTVIATDEIQEILVTGATRREFAIADHLASNQTSTALSLYGAIVSIGAFDLAAVLAALGIRGRAAAAITGIVSANDGATSLAELLPILRENLQNVYRNIYIQDIRQNPQNYANWLYNPNTDFLYDMDLFDN
jgi:hypothetical protein